jgi:hypothetical protein
MEMAAILAMTPPAMAPAFELCRPTGTGVPVFEDVVVEAETEADDELDAPSTVPGPSSGESIKVRHGRETATGGIKGREFSPPVAYDLF